MLLPDNRLERIGGVLSIAIAATLIVLRSVVADAGPLFDETKRVVLPSDAATTILEWYVADDAWSTSEWAISFENLDRLEVGLTWELTKADFDKMTFRNRSFYRQYMPAQWKGLHLIVVNGFYQSASDLFPDKNIPSDLWKRKLVWAFGGGCTFWRAIYVVEQNRYMVLKSHSRHATVVCNGPK